MWFSLFGVVLILAITFFQGLQGLFTAVINCILTILAAALAFGLYEDIFYSFLISSQPEYGRAIAFIGIFVVAAVILRIVVDMLITENLRLPVYVDRAGGGAFGLVTALVVVGMLSIGFQMLPFGPSIMGFSRYKVVENREGRPPEEYAPLDYKDTRLVAQSMLLQPDGFTVGLMSLLSANSLHGRTNLTDIYPDFLGNLHWPRSHLYGKVRGTLPLDAIKVIGYWDLKPGEFYAIAPEKEGGPSSKKAKLIAGPPPDAGFKRRAVRVAINGSDEGGVYRFVPQQVRLVARERKSGPMKEYFLIGLDEEVAGGKLVEVYPARSVEVTPKGDKQFDFVFQVPDSSEFQIAFIEYKGARAELTPSLQVSKKPLPPLGPKPKGPAPKPKADEPKSSPPTPPKPEEKTSSSSTPKTEKPGQDRVSGVGPARDCFLNNHLPFTLTDYSAMEPEFATSGGQAGLSGGRIYATLGADWQPTGGGSRGIDTLFVPEGKRMLQLSVEKLQPGSWIGNIYGTVIDQIADFYLICEGGQQYKPVGAYAMADINGKKVFELVFLNDIAREAGRGIPKFQHIHPRELQGEYGWYFLFHLPPGSRPTQLHTGRQNVDLRPLQLVVE